MFGRIGSALKIVACSLSTHVLHLENSIGEIRFNQFNTSLAGASEASLLYAMRAALSWSCVTKDLVQSLIKSLFSGFEHSLFLLGHTLTIYTRTNRGPVLLFCAYNTLVCIASNNRNVAIFWSKVHRVSIRHWFPASYWLHHWLRHWLISCSKNCRISNSAVFKWWKSKDLVRVLKIYHVVILVVILRIILRYPRWNIMTFVLHYLGCPYQTWILSSCYKSIIYRWVLVFRYQFRRPELLNILE